MDNTLGWQIQQANSADPDPVGAVWSGASLFVNKTQKYVYNVYQ